MSTEHPNATRIKGLFAAFRAGDIETIAEVIGEDAVWHFPGRVGKLAGTHRGRDAILAFLLSVVELTGGTFHLELLDVVANESWAAAFFVGRGERNDRTLENPTTLKMRLQNGRIKEIWEFVWDLYAVEDFWA